MKSKTKTSFPLGVFLPSVCVIAICCCVAACVVFSKTNALGYGTYVALLLAFSLGGGLLITLFSELTSLPAGRRVRRAEERAAALERENRNLEQLAERREEFVASFAHELKTPLTAIIGYADMIRSKEMTPKNRFTAAGYIFSEGKRLEALSLKLMDIIVADKQETERRRFDAPYFIREVATVAMPSLANEGMTLELRWEQGEVYIEPDLFKTLMINLIDNARKASRRGQTIEFYGRAEAGGYAFYVRDHGRGMKKEELSKIAEPFYMIDKSRSRAQNGAGLGLALCSKIASLHGTALEYESEPDKGTTVRVFLKAGSGV